MLVTIFSFLHSTPRNILSKPFPDSGKRGMNPVKMTINNARKEYLLSRASHQRPPVLKSAILPTELWGSAGVKSRDCMVNILKQVKTTC